jgi:hypothetical protein
MKKFWPLLVAIVAIVITVVGCLLWRKDRHMPNVQFITKRGCEQAGGTIIESGIDGWWFCCGTGACYSCTGEVAEPGSLEANCQLDSPITGPVNPASQGSPATILITIQKKRVIPSAVWVRLDPTCRERLLRDPSAVAGCKLGVKSQH